MALKRSHDLPSTVHVELFVVPRSKRSELLHRSRDLYRVVRPPTRRRNGVGPWLFLLEGKPRRRTIPQNLRSVVEVRPDEDLWLELAFYSGPSAMRETLRQLWKRPQVVRLAQEVERLSRKRSRSWTIATGAVAIR